MNATATAPDIGERIAVDRKTLALMLGIGTHTADQIGTRAGAVIRIGKRKLYNVRKVKEYLDAITA